MNLQYLGAEHFNHFKQVKLKLKLRLLIFEFIYLFVNIALSVEEKREVGTREEVVEG